MYRNSRKNICAIILAAGNSKRFGENKLLYSVDGTPMLTHIAECMLMMKKEGFLRTVLCVTQPGPTEDLIGSALPVVLNTHPEQGISLSIRLGLEKLHELCPDSDACLFCVADQPYLQPETIRELIACFQNSGCNIAACTSGSVIGNPVLFSSAYYPQLSKLTGDRGGKKIVLQNLEDTAFFEVPSGQLKDLDTKPGPFPVPPPSFHVRKAMEAHENFPVSEGYFFRPGSMECICADTAFPFLSHPDRQPYVVSLVGGGGKTTLMYYMAHLLSSRGKKVVVTTSTHIKRPDDHLLAGNMSDILRLWDAGSFAVIGKEDPRSAGQKLSLPDPLLLKEAAVSSDFTLIEADGSKRLPIKVPGDQEPVILPETDVVIGVMGLSAVGRPLEDFCFRPEAAERLLHIKMSDTKNNPGEQGHILTAADAAAILQSPQGTRKNVGSRPFYLVLNQFDGKQRRETAEEIFRRLSKDPRTEVIFSAFR